MLPASGVEFVNGSNGNPKIIRLDGTTRDGIANDLVDHAAACSSHFVETIFAMSHNRLHRAELRESLCHDAGGFKVRSPDQLVVRTGWIRKRAKKIEHRAHLQLLTGRRGVLHRRVNIRSIKEGDASLSQAGRHLSGGKVNIHSQNFQHIRTAGMGRKSPVTVLGHMNPAGSHHNGNGGRDVERGEAIATRAAGIEDSGPGRSLDRVDVGAHRFGKAGHFFHPVTKNFTGCQEGSNQGSRHLSIEDGFHCLPGFVTAKALAGANFMKVV